jgi:hypothetical protein
VVWLFAAWCAIHLFTEVGLVLNALEADRNPLLPDEAIRTLLWYSVGPAAAYALGAVLSAARLSRRGRSSGTWRLGVGLYAVLLVVVEGLGWV